MNPWRLLDGALLLCGIGAVTVGVALVFPPAAWMVAGMALIGLGLMSIRRA
jgi:hypothetical protein